MSPNTQEPAELVTFTEEILMENFIFCAGKAFSGERDFQCTFSREAQTFCKELAKSNHRPSNPELCGRLQDLLSRDAIPEFFSTSMKKKEEKMLSRRKWRKC